jgi:hypothetical protein
MQLKLQHCDATNKSFVVPQTAIAWEEKSPFYIKFSKSWGPFSRYVAAIECDENTTTKDDTGSHENSKVIENGNPRPKYKVVSCAKHDGSDLKLIPLHFKPAVSSKLPAPVTLKGAAMDRLSFPQSDGSNNPSVFPANESNTSKPMHNAESDCSSSPRNASRTESDSSLPTPTDEPYAENDSKPSHEENPDELASW